MKQQTKQGIGLVEIVLAVFILALAVGPIVGMLGQGRRRTLSDDRLLAAHLAARAALEESITLAERQGIDAVVASSPASGECASAVSVKPVESLPGLWQFTSTVTVVVAGNPPEFYVLSRLWRDPACLPGLKEARS